MARFDCIAAYIVANHKKGTIYTGATANLVTRIEQHKTGGGSRFTAQYGVDRLVWYERFDEMTLAVARERRIKAWPRQWKIELIEDINPDWEELAIT